MKPCINIQFLRYDNNEIQKSIKLKSQVKPEQVCGEELLVGQDDQ